MDFYKNFKPSINLFSSILILIILSSASLAHLDAGEDKVVNDYLIDFGYSPKDLTIQESAFFTFNILNATTNEVIAPTSAWIRIFSSKDVVYTGTMYPDPNFAFTYRFPYADNYEFTIRLNQDEKVVAETKFEVKVMNGKKKADIWFFTTIGLLIVLVIILLVKIFRKKIK